MAGSFTKGSATFMQGSKSVTGVNLSRGTLAFFDTGTRVEVGSDPLMAVVEATSAGDTTITLAENWPYATGLYNFNATMTSEGINSAVQALRTSSDQLDEANAIIAAVGSIYPSVADGLADTINGDYFSVSGNDPDIFSILYRNDSGTATEISRLSSAEAIEDATQAAIDARTAADEAEADLTTFQGQYDQFVIDYGTFSTDFSTFETDYSQFVTDFGTFSANYSQFATDYASFVTDYGQFQTDYSTFVTNFGTFSTDFSTFETNYAQFVTDYGTFTTDYSQFVTDFGTFSANYSQFATDYASFVTVQLPLAEQYRDQALAYRDTAASYANFIGQWSSLTGTLNIPAAVEHNGVIWQLLVDLADVAASEPSTGNTDWLSLTSASTTDDLPEGTTNLYFTDNRAVSAIQADPSWNATNWDAAYSVTQSLATVATSGQASDVSSTGGNVQTDIDELKALTPDTLADAKALKVPVGVKVVTSGYHEEGDGGGNTYITVAGGTGTDDGGSFIDMANGNQLKGVFPDGVVNIRQFGASPQGSESENTNAIQACIDYGALCIFVPSGNYSVTSLSYDYKLTFYGDGKIIPSNEFQTEQYGGLKKAGVKIGNTYPLDKHGGLIVGGEGPTEHGPMLKSQYVASMDAISSREGNPLEFQLYPNASSGVVTTDGSGRVVFLKGFNGSLSNVFVNDLLWVNGTEYRVAAKVNSTTVDLINEPGGGAASIPSGDYSSHHLYFTVDTVVNISGTTVTRVGGEAFQGWGGEHNILIDGTYYTASVIDKDNLTLSTAPGDATGKAAVFRWLSDEKFVEVLRWQRLLGQGTEETYSIAARPDEYLHRVGFTPDGIGRPSRLRFETAENINDPLPSNKEPKSALVLHEGKAGFGKLEPLAVTHSRSRFDAAQGANDGANYICGITEAAWNDGEGGTRQLNVEAINDFSAPSLQGRVKSTNAVARLNINASGGTVGLGTSDGNDDGDIYAGSTVKPVNDNSFSLGNASRRWSEVYAGTGTINTSDARQKQQVQDIELAVLQAWSKVDFKQYKFNDAVSRKGVDGARWHFGVIAQEVKEAFESEDLDPFAYGLLCYDEWSDIYETHKAILDDEGNEVEPAKQVLIKPAGSAYGIRYEEALALECAYLRAKLNAEI